MENFGETEPHEPKADSERKRKKMKTIRSPLTEVQKFRSDPNIQKREPDSSSVRMEKFKKATPVAEIDEEKSKKHFAMKDQEKKKVRDSVDLESDKLVWETLTEMEKPDNGAEIRNT